MSDSFLIKGEGGKHTLEGEVIIGGAKNAALKLMAATILFRDEVVLKNVPHIEDVHRMVDLLRDTGKVVEKKNDHTYLIQGDGPYKSVIAPEISKRLRASVVLTGPLLARGGHVQFPHPGGCLIGGRPIDLFLEGFKQMGATVRTAKEVHHVTAPQGGLVGATIFLKNQSVTATETFLMAGVLAKGETVIQNASFEPEIADLAKFLRMGGARIKGVGTTTLRVRGGSLLRAQGKTHTVIPDRIEAGSFLILGALAAKKLVIKKCDTRHLKSLIEALRYAGVSLDTTQHTMTVSRGKKKLKAGGFKTHEYPGFPTDLQAPMVVFLTQTEGESLVFETIFEGRLNYTEQLVGMGASIVSMDPHRIMVKGATPLHGKVLESPDLRAGLAFIIAAVVAKGASVVHNVYNIDRGYEHIDARLQRIGVDIVRQVI